MGMLGTFINLQITHLTSAQRTARHHALDGLFDKALGKAASQRLRRRASLDPAGMPRVIMKFLVRHLVAGQTDLFGVDNDDVIAAIDGRRKRRPVLAAKPLRDNGGQTSQNDAVGVKKNPPLFLLAMFQGKTFRLHAAFRKSYFSGHNITCSVAALKARQPLHETEATSYKTTPPSSTKNKEIKVKTNVVK